MNPITKFLYAGVAFFPIEVHAQDVCQILAANLKQDVLIQGSSSELFQTYQQLIRDEKYNNWQVAKNTSLGIGITIPDYVDFSLNSKSDENSWQANRQTFLSLTASSLSQSARSSLESHHANERSIEALAHCQEEIANREGFFVELASISPGRDTFSITLQNRTTGNSGFKVKDFAILPVGASAGCSGGVINASTVHPLANSSNTLKVTCAKLPDKAVTVTINTDHGSGGPFQIGSINDQWATVFDRLQALERSSVPSSTIAFFDAAQCPATWTFDDRLSGRYIVGLNTGGTRGAQVGTKLTDGENRPTGQHSHPYSAVGGIEGGQGLQSGRDNFTQRQITGTTSVPDGSVPGTNSPYIQLLPCKKD